MANFTDILSKKAETVEKPPVKPVGTYLAVVQGLPKQNTPTIQGEERAILEYTYKLMSAHQVDDQDALHAAGEVSSWPPVRQSFWVDSPDGEFAHMQFLTNTLGIEKTGKSTGEMVSEAPGKQIMVQMKHRPYTDKNTNEAALSFDVERSFAV